MAKRKKSIEIAVEHGLALPQYPDHNSAKAAFFESMAQWSQRLRSLVTALQGPSFDHTLESLRELEIWTAEQALARLRREHSSPAELEFLIRWHAAHVAVQCVPHAHWVVEEDPFAAGHWGIGVCQGLCTVMLPLNPSAEAPPDRGRGSTTAEYDAIMDMLNRAGRDPTLHPAVLANQHRLSSDSGVRHCQILTLARSIDAFDEAAVVQALASADDVQIGELLRCLEWFDSLTDETIKVLQPLASRGGYDGASAIGLLIRHRPSIGLRLVEEQRDQIDVYSYAPIVGAIVSIPDLQATSILSDAVQKISMRKHPLWQEREAFAQAVGRLWINARYGDTEAQSALKVVGRRWKRIPSETLELLDQFAPGLTAEIARSGSAPSSGTKPRRGGSQ